MSQNPYQTDSHFSPPPQQDSTIKILLIVLVVVGAGGLLVCTGIMGLAFYTFTEVQKEFASFDFGDVDYQEIQTEVLADSIRESPELKAEIGDLVSVTLDSEKTEKETSEEDYFDWYTVEGTKGSGHIYAKQTEDESGWFNSAELVLGDDRRVPLTIVPVPYDGFDEREVYLQIKDNAKLKTAIGEIQNVTWDQDKGNEDDATYFYKITGKTAEAYAITDESADILVTHIELSDGTKISIGG